jgi:DNA-directed RNA polymerase specialized sigma24 family protein
MELRYFGGFGLEEIAELTGRSLATVKRDWSYARAWLNDRMNDEAAAQRKRPRERT